MKTILFIRHAKSEKAESGLSDTDRPLSKRGYADAHHIGKALKGKIFGNLRFFSSPAIRCISTALIIAREINYPQEKISIHTQLYQAPESVYSDLVFSTDDNLDTIFIFGHNPTISFVISKFAKIPYTEVPTCAASVLNFETDYWAQTVASKCTLEMQLFPKLLID